MVFHAHFPVMAVPKPITNNYDGCKPAFTKEALTVHLPLRPIIPLYVQKFCPPRAIRRHIVLTKNITHGRLTLFLW